MYWCSKQIRSIQVTYSDKRRVRGIAHRDALEVVRARLEAASFDLAAARTSLLDARLACCCLCSAGRAHLTEIGLGAVDSAARSRAGRLEDAGAGFVILVEAHVSGCAGTAGNAHLVADLSAVRVARLRAGRVALVHLHVRRAVRTGASEGQRGQDEQGCAHAGCG